MASPVRCACGHSLTVTEDRVDAKVACPKRGTLTPVRGGAEPRDVLPRLAQ